MTIRVEKCYNYYLCKNWRTNCHRRKRLCLSLSHGCACWACNFGTQTAAIKSSSSFGAAVERKRGYTKVKEGGGGSIKGIIPCQNSGSSSRIGQWIDFSRSSKKDQNRSVPMQQQQQLELPFWRLLSEDSRLLSKKIKKIRLDLAWELVVVGVCWFHLYPFCPTANANAPLNGSTWPASKNCCCSSEVTNNLELRLLLLLKDA